MLKRASKGVAEQSLPAPNANDLDPGAQSVHPPGVRSCFAPNVCRNYALSTPRFADHVTIYGSVTR